MEGNRDDGLAGLVSSSRGDGHRLLIQRWQRAGECQQIGYGRIIGLHAPFLCRPHQKVAALLLAGFHKIKDVGIAIAHMNPGALRGTVPTA